jgi:hypothetical protein
VTAGGWHPDPTGRHQHRWWDGARWTDAVADAGVTGTDAFRAPVEAGGRAASDRSGLSGRAWAALAAGGAALVVGGAVLVAVLMVSGDDTSSGGATSSTGAGTSTECELLTLDELQAAVGVEFADGVPTEEAGNPGCVWESTAPPSEGLPGPIKIELFVFSLTAEDRQAFDDLAADDANENVALGDLAVVRCDIEADVGPGCDAYGPLFVTQGDRYLAVELGNYSWPDDLTQDEVLDALVEMGDAALARAG